MLQKLEITGECEQGRAGRLVRRDGQVQLAVPRVHDPAALERDVDNAAPAHRLLLVLRQPGEKEIMLPNGGDDFSEEWRVYDFGVPRPLFPEWEGLAACWYESFTRRLIVGLVCKRGGVAFA